MEPELYPWEVREHLHPNVGRNAEKNFLINNPQAYFLPDLPPWPDYEKLKTELETVINELRKSEAEFIVNNFMLANPAAYHRQMQGFVNLENPEEPEAHNRFLNENAISELRIKQSALELKIHTLSERKKEIENLMEEMSKYYPQLRGGGKKKRRRKRKTKRKRKRRKKRTTRAKKRRNLIKLANKKDKIVGKLVNINCRLKTKKLRQNKCLMKGKKKHILKLRKKLCDINKTRKKIMTKLRLSKIKYNKCYK